MSTNALAGWAASWQIERFTGIRWKLRSIVQMVRGKDEMGQN
jgi:hypothetical protein